LSGEPSVRPFRPGDEPAILAVIDAALPVDRLPGITRQDLVHGVNRLAGDPGGTVVALEGDEIVGYCTPRHDDVTVHPAFRRLGHGRRLIAAALEMLRSRGQPNLILYGPADRPAAAGFIEALGFTYHSSLWLFELAPSVEVAPPAFGDDVAVRTYRHPDDLAAYVRLANESFVGHPTPVSFTEPTVAHAHGLADFNPAGILLAAPRDDPDRLIGWAKAEHEVVESGERRGFVSFVGVVPEWRGRGLGRELLRWAIARCRAAEAGTIELNVEAANDRALELYRRTGFTAEVEWPHYALPVPRSSGSQPSSGGPSRASAPA
jgi:mycothiol synthase